MHVDYDNEVYLVIFLVARKLNSKESCQGLKRKVKDSGESCSQELRRTLCWIDYRL